MKAPSIDKWGAAGLVTLALAALPVLVVVMFVARAALLGAILGGAVVGLAAYPLSPRLRNWAGTWAGLEVSHEH